MGFKDLIVRDTIWSLVSQDDGSSLEGQFPAMNVEENVSGMWATEGTLGLAQPILQFIRGELETISCEVRVYARHQGILGVTYGPIINVGIDKVSSLASLLAGREDAQQIVEAIKNLARPDPALGRPHIWLFSIGDQFQQTVVIRGVGGIKYDKFRPEDGSIRGATFTLDMARYVTPARTGETYEHIAARVHGSPLLGEALRRRNPERRDLVEGDLVHVPDAKILKREVIPLRPQSLFFKEGDAQRQLLLDTLEVHAG
jgi:hypothetical protein